RPRNRGSGKNGWVQISSPGKSFQMPGAGTLTTRSAQAAVEATRATSESPLVRWSLIAVAALFLGVFLFMPLAVVFSSALAKGSTTSFASFHDPDALSAIRLTLLAAAIAVPLNMIFGIAAAWTVAKFDFIGKSLLITLIDLPFSVSPVVSGLIYVLIFGL